MKTTIQDIVRYGTVIWVMIGTAAAQTIPEPKDRFQPYLNRNGMIVEGNAALYNPDRGETSVDTIFYDLAVTYPQSPGFIIRLPGDTMLIHHLMFTTTGYAIWQKDAKLGNHWHVYDALRRPIEFLIQQRRARVWIIQQTGEK